MTRAPKPPLVNKFVLHTIGASGVMEDRLFDSKNQRDRAADAYLKANPGKQVWKTQTKRTA